ncbi:CDO1 dioxygenase, partial [Polyodon spathula]|nr:CDO1 dioxygenase [Polyodon spathula]
MLLCWGETHGSSIHDHTNSHCFLKLLQGRLKETLYDWPEDQRCKQELQKRCEIYFEENQCTYINDSIGLHRVENSSHCDHAVSLHLYSPPFDTCHTFDERTGHRNSVKMTFWSKYGERTPYVSPTSIHNLLLHLTVPRCPSWLGTHRLLPSCRFREENWMGLACFIVFSVRSGHAPNKSKR